MFFLWCAVFIGSIASSIVYAKDMTYVEVAPSPVSETFVMRAETSPRDSYEVQAPRDGKIVEVYMWPGQEVGQGGVLAFLDDEELRRKKTVLYEQKNELAVHLNRLEKLMEDGHISVDTWEKNINKAARMSAEMTALDEDIHKSYIRASRRGTVIWSDLKVGEEVKGAEPLFWIGDAEQLWLQAEMDEALTKGLQKGDKVIVLPKSSVNDAATEHDLIPGTIDFVGAKGPKGDKVNVYINAPRFELETYVEYDVLLPVPSQKNRWVLPEDVLVDGHHVWTLVAPEATTEQTDLFRARRVEIVPERIEHGTIILDPAKNTALSVGMSVLMMPPHDIRENQVVEASYTEGDEWLTLYTQTALGTRTKPCGSCGDKGPGSIPSLCQLAGGVAGLIGGESLPEGEKEEKPLEVCRIAGNTYENLSPGSFSIDEDISIPSEKAASPHPVSLPADQL